MKKQYMKPAMQVVQLQQQHQLLAGSSGSKVSNVNNTENIKWTSDGIEDDDY